MERVRKEDEMLFWIVTISFAVILCIWVIMPLIEIEKLEKEYLKEKEKRRRRKWY